VAGPMTIHPQQLPEGGHPPVGGHGVTGSADPFQVGVILGCPGERADPFGQEEASVIDASVIAEGVTKLPTGSSEQTSLRQPPTVSDTTAAAFPSSTKYCGQKVKFSQIFRFHYVDLSLARSRKGVNRSS